MEKNTLHHLIQISFLRDAQKEILASHLNGTGADDAFYELFNEYLLEEMQKGGDECERTLAKFDGMMARLDEEFEGKKNETLKKVREELSHTDPADIGGKQYVWTTYYQAVDVLKEDYETKAREALSVLAGSRAM